VKHVALVPDPTAGTCRRKGLTSPMTSQPKTAAPAGGPRLRSLHAYFCSERFILDFGQRTGGYGVGTVAEASFEFAL
jgi:hypothetical protein